jgi:hypothetical protein
VRKFTPDPLPEELALAILNAGLRHMVHNSKQLLKELKTGKDSRKTWLPDK